MGLKNILSEKKDSILALWFDRIIDTYPADTAKFLKSQKDRFANPVGQAIHTGIDGIFQELINDAEIEKLSGFLDTIVRVRAVQDFTPSQAVSFIFFLKGVVRDVLTETPATSELSAEVAAFESQVDSLALIAFDIFMQCREKLFDIKANEMRNMTYRLLEQANMLTGTGATEQQSNFIAIKKKEVTT